MTDGTSDTFTKETPFMSVRLSKSGKAILVYDLEGRCWMTSVVFMKMLCEGRAKNNMIPIRLMGNNTTDNFKPRNNAWDASKIRQVEGDPLSQQAARQRQEGTVKVKGDW